MSQPLAVGVDVGGTFTDAVVTTPDGTTAVKVPTASAPDASVITAIEAGCRRLGLTPSGLDTFRHASTVATNTLLERNGAETALVTTDGFRDVLAIGRQDRPVLYDLAARRPDPLVERSRRYTVDERTPPPGHPTPQTIRSPPDADDLDALADELEGLEAVAVCLLHSDVDPTHEQVVVEHLDDRLDVPVVASHAVDPTVREYERTATTVASAYLTPRVRTYLDRLVDACEAAGIPQPQVMQSSGGIATAEQVADRAVSTVLSGPAAGVVGATRSVDDGLDTAGYITLDMGGTSADVGRVVDGEPTLASSTSVGGQPIRTTTVDIHTVGAGGGSIGWVDDGGALRVGPHSAGADPGPASYGRGGTEATVTDAAVVLGLIGADRTLGGHISIDEAGAESVLTDLAETAGMDDPVAAAAGMYRVAVETMTQAIRHITVERGIDPREDALVAYGGAGGIVATSIADRLDIDAVALPPHAGVTSALGLVAADERHETGTGVHRQLEEDATAELESILAALEAEALERCQDSAVARIERTAACRYAGQSHELTVPVGTPITEDTLTDRVHAAHRRRHGYTLDDPVEVVSVRVAAVVDGSMPSVAVDVTDAGPIGHRHARVPPGEGREYAVYQAIPQRATGPCLIERPNATVVVPPGWSIAAGGTTSVLTRMEAP